MDCVVGVVGPEVGPEVGPVVGPGVGNGGGRSWQPVEGLVGNFGGVYVQVQPEIRPV